MAVVYVSHSHATIFPSGSWCRLLLLMTMGLVALTTHDDEIHIHSHGQASENQGSELRGQGSISDPDNVV